MDERTHTTEEMGADVEVPLAADGARQSHESGQVSIFFMFAVLAAVILMALMVNTARHSMGRIQVQNAADASTLSGGAWAARGLNLVTLNNCGMADILGLMVVVRSTLETCEVMKKIEPVIGAALALVFMETEAAAYEYEGNVVYEGLRDVLEVIDTILTKEIFGFGVLWGPMRALDAMSSVVEEAFPFAAAAEAKHLATLNGADGSFLVPGKSSIDYTPSYPMVRAEPKEMVDFAGACPVMMMSVGALAVFAAAGTPTLVTGLPSFPIAAGIYVAMVLSNLQHLKGEPFSQAFNIKQILKQLGAGGIADVISWLEDIVDTISDIPIIGSFVDAAEDALGKLDATAAADTPPLDWPEDNPPKPHKLEEDGSREIKKYKDYFTYLGVVQQKIPPSPLGAFKFVNRAPDGWIAYAEAHVYNPKGWDMFHQDWKVKLVQSDMLAKKRDEVQLGLLLFCGVNSDFPGAGPGSMPDSSLEFVNNH